VCIGKIIKRLKPRRSKREKKVTREGGVVKRFWTDAPKSIESRELISFSCRFIFTSAENDDRFQRRRACSLSAEYIADGRVVCRAAVKCRYEPNLEREAEKSAELMKAIDTVRRTHRVAEYNGYTLTKLTSYDITLSNNKDVVMTNYALSNITENTSVKLFVWDSYWGTTPKANPITLFTENDMEISVNFMYDNAYTEKAFNRGETIKAQVNAKSTKWWSQAVNLYIALYDENNKLISLASANSNIISDGNYQFIDVELPLAQDLPSGYIVKTFVWESQSMKPYLTNETIVSTDDYHADNIQNARYVNISKAVNGIINTDTDKDFIKFIPTVTQDYLIQLFGNEQLGITLYNSDGAIITTNDDYYSANTGTIIEQTLTKGEMYYVGLSGTAQDEYTLTITPNTKQTDNLQITGNEIIATGQAEATQSLNAKLLSTTGNLVSTQEFTVDETGNYTVNVPTDLSSGEYYFAILNANTDLRGTTIYVDLFPCNECAKAIIQAGIKKVIYLSDKYNGTDGNIVSKKLFDECGVEYKQFKSQSKTFTIEL